MMLSGFGFWQKWLFYSSLMFALFGVLFSFWGDNPIFHLYNASLGRIFFGAGSFPAEADAFRAFIYGPLGGTIACAYILLAFIAAYPFARKEKWAYLAILTAFGVWVLMDSVFCWYYGVYFQVWLINLPSVIVKALPLYFTRKEFGFGKYKT